MADRLVPRRLSQTSAAAAPSMKPTKPPTASSTTANRGVVSDTRSNTDATNAPPTYTVRDHGPLKEIRSPARTMTTPGQHPPADEAASQPAIAIDPISRQILERSHSRGKGLYNVQPADPSHSASGPSEDATARLSTDAPPIRRVESAGSAKLTKEREKKKGVSFLSRIMGNKKRDDALDVRDNESELSDTRPAGMDAEVFSQPIGFVPKYPQPPKYIKVKSQNRKEKDFDRVFLAQVLLGDDSRRKKNDTDAKIIAIDDAPRIPPSTGVPPVSRAIWAMEFSKDGKYLAAAGQDKKLRVWQVLSSVEDREAEEKGSNNGNDAEDHLKLEAPVFRKKLAREYDGHTSSILDISWSKNNFLLSSSMDKTVRLYHVTRQECLCAFKHNDFVTSIQFHPRDDRFFLAGSLDQKLRLWSIPDKNVAYMASVPDMVTACAFTPDGKTAIAGCLNGLCILYDTEGLKAHSQIHVRSARGRNAKGSKITGIDAISVPSNSPTADVKLLITSNDSRVRMYNLKDRTLEIKFRGNENACSQIHASFSDDGKYVICGSEDRKVYIWPTGASEKQDPEKRPVECFEAHSAIVTTAVLAPTKTRILLAQSGDPLYDLCNPPPVTLLGRADSVISSRAPTENSGRSNEALSRGDHQNGALPHPKADSPRRAPETPAYLARHAHPGGNIIVTADYAGQIKIFRQDCAAFKRRHESWDNASTFGKKVLNRTGRSGSVTTRGSASSLNNNGHRFSLHLGSKSPSADRIINWRDSVSDAPASSMSEVQLSSGMNGTDRDGSHSPQKQTPGPRLSLRQRPTPIAHDSYHANHNINTTTPPPTPPVSQPTPFSQSPEHVQTTFPASQLPPPNINVYSPQTSPSDPLMLQGTNQSFMYWNVKDTLANMVQRPTRSPALFPADGGRNPLSRKGSYVSRLSSEEGSSDLAEDQDVEEEGGEGEDIQCANCGGKSFRAVRGGVGEGTPKRLRCRRCGVGVE